MWCKNETRNQAEIIYGHISKWDVSKVTSTKDIFKGATAMEEKNKPNFLK